MHISINRRGRVSVFTIAIAVVALLQACGGSSKKGCSGTSDCETGQVCVNGACVVNDDVVGGDTSVDATDDLSSDQSDDGLATTCGTEGEIVCNEAGTAFRKCVDGEWRNFECPARDCEATPGLANTGLQPGLCDNGVGCVLTTCEACPNHLRVDLTTLECYTSCNDGGGTPHDTRCWPGYSCVEGTCTLAGGKQPGQSCTDGDECKSGFCVRGLVDGTPSSTTKVCCETECTGTCAYCGSDGKCKTVDPGKPNPESCPSKPIKDCQQTGNCNDKGECELYADDTVCAPATCENDKELEVSTCQGGICKTPTGVDCTKGCKGNLICDSDPCVAHSDCTGSLGVDWFCRKDPTDSNKGICARKRGLLANCDGLSFPSDIDGNNAACLSGNCAPDNFSGHGPSYICVPDSQCNWLGQKSLALDTIRCSGNDFSMTCTVKAWGSKSDCTSAPCEATTGVPNSGFRSKHCVDGEGCDATCTACVGGFLADESGCKTSCGADTDCQPDYYCDSQTKACLPRKNDGVACTADRECRNGACVEGADETTRICCSQACTGKCNYCGETNDGTFVCMVRQKGTLDTFCTASNTSDVTCGVSTCSGDDEVCEFPGLNTACPPDPLKPQVCENGSLYRWRCDGKGGCERFEYTVCDNGCNSDGSSCKASCTKHSDCTDADAATYCSSSGKCLPKLADGINCTNESYSPTARDGVCKSGSCALDTLTLTNSSGTTTNYNGAYYCRPQGSCIDAMAKDAPMASIRAKNYFVCNGSYDATGKGVKTYVCNGTDWVSPSSGGSSEPNFCNVSALRPSNRYPGDGKKNTAGYWTGYLETLCNEGDLGTGGSNPPGCVESKKDCGAYMHEGGASIKCLGQSCKSTIEICTKFCGICPIAPQTDPQRTSTLGWTRLPRCEDCCAYGTKSVDDDTKCDGPTYSCTAGKCGVF
ncbi:MAG: hypothetical protein KC609_05175 [Myxococcales bacterium]|nr:hypothetical protein [Myxococcales bacterium]